MTFKAKEISRLQIAENTAYRNILEARRNTPISALRGEIGSSLMETRIMESKLLFTKHILEGSNNLTKQILKESRMKKNNIYNRTLSKYLKKLNIYYEQLTSLSKENIKNRAREWDTEKWKEDMESKSTTKRHTGGDTKCELCDNENEDLIHFLIDCKELENKRNKQIMEKNLNQDKEVMAGKILFGKEDKEDIKYMIDRMWKFRLGKKIQNENKKEALNIKT